MEGARLICAWCKKPIDRRVSAYMSRTERLPNGEKWTYNYHAKACYSSWQAFLDLHSFQPLDPSTHGHE